MIRSILDSLKWSSRLGAKFFWAAPAATSGVVFFTLVSQLSMLLAFFLPLKVIILLGSDGIPRYFPPAFEQVDRDQLIISLSVATILFYLLYLGSERLVEWGAERGAARLLARGRKMVLFEGQDEMARRSYKRYASALAGGIFVFLAVVLLVWLYPAVAGIIIAYLVLTSGVLLAALIVSESFRQHLDNALSSWTAVLAALGFMLAFIYLVIDFLFREPPGLIPAIIALLLSRQAFNRLSGAVPAIQQLYRQRPKLDALFFHKAAYIPRSGGESHPVRTILQPEQRERWVGQVLSELVSESADQGLSIQWLELNVRGVYALWCGTDSGETYLVKLFDRNRSGQARHEATLLASPPGTLASPGWLGSTTIDGWHVHLFRCPVAATERVPASKKMIWNFRYRMLETELSPSFLKQYERSRSYLWQRLSPSMLTDLRAAASDDERARLNRLEHCFEQWLGWLAATPVALASPDVGPFTVVPAHSSGPVLLHWGRWSLEPAGSGWPINKVGFRDLGTAYQRASRFRAAHHAVSLNQLWLAALTFQLESDWQKERYSQALGHLPLVEQCLQELQAGGEPEVEAV
ncbi:hypothetical protein [Thioalkalivibrio sp. AKL17]|uniref:hypothetical protein n=1 Tax=Thioalkalivibrio sp. AKL17 TaxID=1158160 RepID=UPI00035C25F2|nr:hypothetical protein [Thioalkalivibrio sp. AKL17]